MRCWDSSGREVELAPATRVLENVLRRYCHGRADLVLRCNTIVVMLASNMLDGDVRKLYEERLGECPEDLVKALRYELEERSKPRW